jgi:hypothetical protein
MNYLPMGKEEYTPPRITRREAVSKFTIAGLGGAGAGTQMAVSPMDGDGSPESMMSPVSSSSNSDADSDSSHPSDPRGPPEWTGPPDSTGDTSHRSRGKGERGHDS